MLLKQNALKRIFRDIVRGFSLSYYKDKRIYIKHVGVIEQVDIDDYRLEHLEKAEKRGIPTEAEILKFLNEEGDWSEQDERFLKEKESFITRLIENKSGLYLQSQLDSQDKLIEEAREDLYKKQQEKVNLVGNTCETYADKRCIDLYIIKSFFHDLAFQQPVFTEESFDEIGSADLSRVSSLYNSIFNEFTDLNFQKLALDDFYHPYLQCCSKPIDFFGKPAVLLTHHQLRLYTYTVIFKNILEGPEEVPYAIQKDPQRLMDWARNPRGREKAKEVMSKASEGGAGLFGATKEDLEQLGVETSGPGTVSLEKAAKKKGGSLNMQDLMKLSGI